MCAAADICSDRIEIFIIVIFSQLNRIPYFYIFFLTYICVYDLD